MSSSTLSVKNYFEKMKAIQINLLKFIENDDDIEEKFQNLINIFKVHKIGKNYHLLKSTLYIIKYIVSNHHRTSNFIPKISKIILFFKNEIKQTFSNYEIFNIFKNNKLILLSLFKEEIIIPDKSISFYIQTEKYKNRSYPQYFLPEFKNLFSEKLVKEIEPEVKDIDSETFQQKRQIGENDDYVCQLIRNDSIDEFIQFLESKKTYFSKIIKPSIFETNSFFIDKKNITFMEYASFYNSVKILNYLESKNNHLNPSLWKSSIHSCDIELLKMLQEKKVSMSDEIYDSCLVESIKCHHNEIFNFFKENFSGKTKSKLLSKSMKYYNFVQILTYKNPEYSNFYELCSNDYYVLVQNYLKNKGKISMYSDDEILIFFINSDILFYGTRKGYVELVEFEMQRGKYKINDEFILFLIFHTISIKFCFNDVFFLLYLFMKFKIKIYFYSISNLFVENKIFKIHFLMKF